MNTEEQEKAILEIVRAKFEKTGRHNGNRYDDFDHIINLPILERTTFLEKMAAEKKIRIYNEPNYPMITLPK